MKSFLGLLFVTVLLAVVSSETPEESFTIFIDLDDFHVQQADNHHFLTGDAIGEHDNVLLQLSEEEVKYHMDRHNTHDCQPPSEVHEVVSFIQENMYAEPAVPSEQFGAFPNPMMQQPMVQQPMMQQPMFPQQMMQQPMQQPMFPFGNLLNPAMFRGGAPAAAPAPATAPADIAKPAPVSASEAPEAVASAPATQAAPEAVSAPLGATAPTTAGSISAPAVQAPPAAPVAQAPLQKPTAAVANAVDTEEEEAVNRFRDAYKAYKYFGHAMEGLGDLAEPAATAGLAKPQFVQPQAAVAAPAVQQARPSIFDSLLDEDDKRLINMFTGHKQNPVDLASQPSDLDATISNIVDEAYKNVMANNAVDIPQPSQSLFDSVSNAPYTGEFQAEFPEPQQPLYQPVYQPPAVETAPEHHSHHHAHHHHHSSEDEAKEETPTHLVAQTKPGPIEVEVDAPSAAATTETTQVKDESVVPKPSGASRPAAPTMVSHIEKAPKPTEFVPESVYQKQAVPFNEVPNAAPKHLPKRILIPRMEEPGPVIGGGSKPMHIKLPALDDIIGSTRPAAPARLSSNIGNAAATATANTVVATNKASASSGAATTISVSSGATAKTDVSTKASTVAAANDEALTAPEVVVF